MSDLYKFINNIKKEGFSTICVELSIVGMAINLYNDNSPLELNY